MKYGKEIIAQITEQIKAGMSNVDACAVAGINEDTFYEWKKDKKKPEFSEAIKKAEMECKQRSIVRIQNASRQHWQAAAWWLERKYPEEFALRQKHEVTGAKGAPLVKSDIDLSKITDDQLIRLIDALESRPPKE